MKNSSFSGIKNQSGTLAVDFILSFTLACLLSMMILAITATFTVVEISQYVAFSGARAMASADADIQSQKSRGEAKIKSLLADPVLRPMFSQTNNWFSLSLKDIRTGGKASSGGDDADYSGEYGKYIFQTGQFVPQVGLRLNLEAKILHFKIPFLGSTTDNDGAGYNATVTGFILREPSQAECHALMNQKRMLDAVRALDSRYSNSAISNFSGNDRLPLEDNGC